MSIVVELDDELVADLANVLLEDPLFVSRVMEDALRTLAVIKLWEGVLRAEKERLAHVVEEDYARERGILAENE